MFIRIQTRILFLIAVFAVLFLGGLLLKWQNERNTSFNLLAEREVEKGILFNRISHLVGKTLTTFAYDYSYWDEMCEFVDTADPEWAKKNLDEGVNTYGAHAAWIYGQDLTRVYSVNTLDDSTLRDLPLTTAQMDSLTSSRPFSDFFFWSGSGLIEIRGAPIQPSDDTERKTEPHGYMFAGRLWSAEHLDKLSLQIGSRVSITPSADSQSVAGQDIEGFTVTNAVALRSWDGHEIATLVAVTEFQSMKAAYDETRTHFLVSTLFVIVVMLVIALFLFYYVTNPLSRISASLKAQNPFLIENVRNCRTEFAVLADLMIEFFSQKSKLQAEIEQRRQSEAALRESEALISATLESTGDGILVIDKSGKVIQSNRRFAELWRIPQSLIEERDDEKLIRYVLDQLLDPQAFLDKVQRLYQSADEDFDTLLFKDGRVFDRFSFPLMLNETVAGRVWNFRDVTQRRRADEVLLSTKNMLETLIETAPLPICTLDLDGRIGNVWNPAAERMLGWCKADVQGRINPMVAAEHAQDYRRDLEQLREGKAIYDTEIQLITRDGTLLTASYYSTVLHDANGQINGAITILVDQTERKQAEKALRESEERFRNLADTAPVLIWMAGVDRHCYYFNRTWLKFTGRSLQHEYGKGWLEGVHPDDREACLNSYRTAFAARRAFSIEFRLRSTDGTYRWLLDRGAPRFSADGSFTGYIGTCTDISDRRNAEEGMRESEERFRAIFETAHDAIFIRDYDLAYTHVNPGSEKFLGLPPAQVIGKTNTEIYGEAIAKDIDQSDRCVLQGETTEEEFTHIIKGVPTTFHLIKVPIRDVKGDITGICGIARDISERKQTEEALRESEARFRAIFEGAHDPIFIKDLDRRYIHVNQAMADSYRLSLSEIFGQCDDDLLESSVAEEVCRNDLRVLAGETVEQEVITEVAGKPIAYSVIKVPFRGSGDHIIGLVGIARDITDRRQAEDKIAEWNRRYEMVVASSGQVVYDDDLKTGIIHWSGSVEKVLGYAEHEILETNERWLDRIHPDDRDEILRQLQTAKQNAGSYDIFYRYRHQDGHYIWINDRGFYVANAESQVVRALGMMHDVTEQRQAEEALRQSEERLRAIVDSAPYGAHLYELQPDDRLLFIGANKAANRILSIDHEQFIGKTIEEAFPALADTEVPQRYRHVVRTGERYQANQVDYDEGGIRGAFEVHAFRTGENRMAVFFRDVTESKKVENLLREAAQTAQAIVEAAPLPMIILRLADRKVMLVNSPLRRVLGIAEGEAVEFPPMSHFDNDDLRRKAREQLEHDGCVHGMRVNLKHTDGTPVTLIGSASLFQLNGEPAVIAMAVPISESVEKDHVPQDTGNPAVIGHHLEALYHEIKDSLDRVRTHVVFPEDQDKWKI